MCSALGSRTDPSRRSAFGQVASSFAEVRESPLANNVTSFPKVTSSSVNQYTTRSVPPYSRGGTASVSGATCAMRISPSPYVADPLTNNRSTLHWHRRAAEGTFSHVRSSPADAYFLHTSVLLVPSRAIRCLSPSMLQDCCAVMATRREPQDVSGIRSIQAPPDNSSLSSHMV